MDQAHPRRLAEAQPIQHWCHRQPASAERREAHDDHFHQLLHNSGEFRRGLQSVLACYILALYIFCLVLYGHVGKLTKSVKYQVSDFVPLVLLFCNMVALLRRTIDAAP